MITLNARKLLLRFLSLFIGLLVGLVLAELICRVFLFGWDVFAFRKVNSFTPIGYSGFVKPAEHQHVWYDLKPGSKGLFKMHGLTVNSQGLRVKEFDLVKPSGTYRIAVIGDSYTFGDGVNIEETYHSLLEDRLNQVSDSLRFELINFGLGGYNLLNYHGVIAAKALAYQPDLVLISFCGNNDDDIAKAPQYSEPYKGHRFIQYAWFIRHFQLLRSVGAVVDIGRRKEGIAKQTKLAEKKAFVTQMFSEFGKLQAESGVPFLVAYLSMADAPPEKADLVCNLSQENGFRFIDTSPVVDTLGNIEDYWFHATDHHPNAAMHRIYADILQKHFMVVKPEFKDARLALDGD